METNTPVVDTPVVTPEPSLLQRVSSFKPEPVVPVAGGANSVSGGMISPKEIDEIKDPILRNKVERTYKSIQSD